MKQLLLKTALVLAITFIISSCDKSDPPPSNIVNIAATLNGGNEVPPNASTNTGTATGTYNTQTKILTLTVNWSGFTASNAHIHKGAAGIATPGNVLYALGAAPFTSPLNHTSAAFTQGQEDSLFASLYYVNVHSAAFPGGEIRGQLVRQ